MADFIYNLFHPLPNAVMTVIAGILVIYWLFVFFSGAGLDDLDLGFDFDVDVPDIDVADLDSQLDADVGDGDNEVVAEKSPGTFMKFLNFMNVGKVPFMLILSTLKFFTWIFTLITTHFINVTAWGVWSLLILAPLLIVGIFFTKAATHPMIKVFNELGYRGEEEIDFVGVGGKMLSTIEGKKIGIAEFIVDRNPIKLNVQSIDGEELKYGESVIIADESADRKIFFVFKNI